MKRFKLPILLLIVSVIALIVAITVNVVIAYMFKQSSEITNVFVPAEVSCEVDEEFNGTLKTSVKVDNTSNIDVYIRLRVVTHWEDSKGNIVARSSPEIMFGKQDGWLYNSDDWIYDSNDYTFYHKAPVAVGDSTSELLSLQGFFQGISLSPETVPDKLNSAITYTYYPVVVFIAEAIQSKPNDSDGAVSKWKVTLDSSGNITQVNN